MMYRSSKKRHMVLQDLSNKTVVAIEAVTPHNQQTAFDLLMKQGNKTCSWCNALFFVVKQRLPIPRALTFDDHFRQSGEFEIYS
jgi:predicted nucleic acid-binding protein